jgi:hypothetical protein
VTPPAVAPAWSRSAEFLHGRRDTVRLDTFRFTLTISLLVYHGAWWRHAEEWLTSAGFHVSSAAAGAYAPVAPLIAPEVLPLFGVLYFGTILLVVAGWRLRFTAPALLLLVLYTTYADPLSAYTLNRLYLVSFAVLAACPAGAYWSVERGEGRPASVWPVRILQATLVIQYFTAGWCKLVHGDWLADPYVMWTQMQGWYRTDLASHLLREYPAGLFSWLQYGALTFELGAPLLFGLRRFRPLGYAAGFVFQIGTALVAHQLIYFSLQMVCFYVLFVDEDRLRRLHSRLAGAARGLRAAATPRR